MIPALMLLGIALGRAKIGLTARHLELLIIYFTMPLLMFTAMLKADLDALSLGGVTVVSLAYLTLCFIVSYGLSSRFSGKERGTIVFNSTFFNSIFLPFPLIYAFYGDLSIAILFSLPTMIVHNTLGVFMASHWGQRKGESGALVSAITFPPLIAFLIGVLARPISVSFVTTQAFEWLYGLGLLTVYLGLIFVGLAIPLSKDSLLVFHNRVTGLTTLTRFLISPLIALILITALNLDGIVRNTILIMSLMPPAITNLIIVSRFGLDIDATSKSIFLQTFLSIGIILLLRYLTLI